MKSDEAKKMTCMIRNTLCDGNKCMAWLQSTPGDDSDGNCAWLCVAHSLTKAASIWGAMVAGAQKRRVIT